MINEPLTEYLPQVRCTATLKRRLERVAGDSITSNLADHIRHAVETYVEAAEADQPPAQPQTAQPQPA
jgi:hypothetical protein